MKKKMFKKKTIPKKNKKRINEEIKINNIAERLNKYIYLSIQNQQIDSNQF